MSDRMENDEVPGTATCPVCGAAASVAHTAADHHYGNPGRFSVLRSDSNWPAEPSFVFLCTM